MIEQFINKLQIELNLDKEGLIFPKENIKSSVKNKDSVFKKDNFIVLSDNHSISHKSDISPIFSFNLDNPEESKKIHGRLRATSSFKNSKEFIFNGDNYLISNGLSLIFQNIESIDPNGYLLVVSEEDDFSEQNNSLSEDYLLNKGYSINAVIGLPAFKSRFRPRNSLYVISKNKKDLFIADIHEDKSNTDDVIDNFINNLTNSKISMKQGDIELGYSINRASFVSLYQERSKSKIAKITAFDKGYKKCTLKEILNSVSSDKTSHDLLKKTPLDNSLFIKNIDSTSDNFNEINTEEKWVESIATIGPLMDDYDHHKYFYISIDKKKVKAEYLVIFLRSYLGRELYKLAPKSQGQFTNIHGKTRASRLTKEDLNQIQIYYPDLNTQDEIIEADSKLNKLQDSLNEFKDGLSTNPNRLIGESSDQIFDLLSTVGKLNNAERIRTHIRKVEHGYSEFKETWMTPVDTEGKILKGDGFDQRSNEIMYKLFRVINSFVNTYGGDLMIGIEDGSHEIRGIEKEIKHWWPKINYEKTPFRGQDKYLEKFKVLLKKSFKEDFIGDEKNIFWDIVPMNGKNVFLIRCRQSSKRCYIQKGDVLDYLGHSFYKRYGDDTIPIDSVEDIDAFWSQRIDKPNQV
jgi:hypothetical protein